VEEEMAENDSKHSIENSANKEIQKINLDMFYGVKAGMTRIFDETGNHVSVTVIKLVPNYVSQVKTCEKDGYNAYQVAYCEKKENLINKPKKGQLKKACIDSNLYRFYEVKIDDVNAENLGKELSFDNFKPQTFIDVTSTSKGKGFQGVIKRYHFSGGPATHGSHFHRTPGSIGNRASPGRVFKNKKMPGHMGDKRITVQNLCVVEINIENGYMLLKGSVPGGKNGFVKISKAKKK